MQRWGTICDPVFMHYAAERNRKGVKLARARRRVRDTRGSRFADVSGGDDGAEAEAKSKAKASGAGKSGAEGREMRALAPYAGQGS